MTEETAELLGEVTAECLEHTARVESFLLTLETNGGQADPEAINDLFRSVHSIKGVVGFCGLNNIKDLAHAFENILGAFRRQELIPDAASVDLLLKTNDFLKEMLVNAVNSDQYDIRPFVRELDRLAAGRASDAPESESVPVIVISDTLGKSYFAVPQAKWESLKAKGHFIYILHLDLIRDGQNRGRTPWQLLAELEGLGEIIDTLFPLDAMIEEKVLPSSLPFGVLYSSLIAPEMLTQALGLLPESCERVPEKAATPPITTPQPTAKPVIQRPVADKPHQDLVLPSDMETSLPNQIEEPGPGEALAKTDAKGWQPENSLRVNVGLLDNLMILAGELVLARNQLLQTVYGSRLAEFVPIGQRIDAVTSELQAQIMQTRMQPLAQVFSKFPRLVRDLSRKLGKQVDLEMEGREVELDKAIVEEIGDPLVHLFRNSIDHGVELPAERIAAGKSPAGKVFVRAYHEAGQVNIEIQDNGRGIDPQKLREKAVRSGLMNHAEAQALSDRQALDLIFRAGFSTAEKVSDVSGRGVGMDVVRASLEKLGGILDVQSQVGHGTTMRIKLPLTMAIIPCLIVRVGKERYAIPQLSLVELVRVSVREIREKIERVGGAEVLHLRDNLLPLVRLAEVLQVSGYYRDAITNELKEDRRANVADRRSGEADGDKEQWESKRSGGDRRQTMAALNIVVLSAGDLQYGLVVDELQDTEEIVVKPFGRHLKEIAAYAGATIMGDGKVAPILDVLGLAQQAHLYLKRDNVRQATKTRKEDITTRKEMEKILLFNYGVEHVFAVPISLVSRAIRIQASDIEITLGQPSIKQRGQGLRLIFLEKHLPLPAIPREGNLFVIVFEIGGRDIGLISTALLDERVVPFELDTHTHAGRGILGSMIVDSQTVVALDVFELVDLEEPTWATRSTKVVREQKNRILLVEDSDFFRDKVTRYLTEAGFEVLTATNGAEGLAVLENQSVSLVITDIEMPVMDGLEMVKKIRSKPNLAHLKIVAVTSLAGDEDIRRGMAAGVDRYQVKLDREMLLTTINQILAQNINR